MNKLLVLLCLFGPHPNSGKSIGRQVYLDALDLSTAHQGWGNPSANRSVGGNPITLHGVQYPHGFGTHSPGRYVVDLKGGSTRFHAVVGIDDETPIDHGSAEFEVIGSGGRILWRSGIMHHGDEPKVANVDIRGLQRLGLVVTDGGDGFDWDHADWADAQFTVVGKDPAPYRPIYQTVKIALPAGGSAPSINGPSEIGVFPGTPLLWKVPVSGDRPMTLSAEGTPEGVKFDPSSGIFSGKLDSPGSYAVRVTAQSARGVVHRTLHFVAGPKLCLTPPMGWNSYDAFGDNVVESEVLTNANYVAMDLQPYGWDTVVVDYRWYDPGAHDNNPNGRAGAKLAMDEYGRLFPAQIRFPSATEHKGFKPLADRIHALGLKFGIHIMRGIPRLAVDANLPIEGSKYTAAQAANTGDKCGWCPDMYGVRGASPAGEAYYDSIFRLYAQWGVDYVKMDDTSQPYHSDEIEAVHKAIDKCGRSIVFSLSPGETPIAEGAHVASHANLWRASGDFWDNWEALTHEFELGDRWRPFVGPGHWPDADMLPIGRLSVGGRSVGPDRSTNFNKNEEVTLLTLWCLLPSPLMVDANLPDNDDFTDALLMNPEVTAIDQDSLGAPARRVVHRPDLQVWSRPLADGSMAVAMFNTGDDDESEQVRWSDLGLNSPCKVRDLWNHHDLGTHRANFSATIPAHAALLLRISKD
jgi:hypothetical protein